MPVFNGAPPVAAAYQVTVAPVFAVAPRVTVPWPHTVPGVVAVILLVYVIWIGVEVPEAGPTEQVTIHWYQLAVFAA